MKVNFQPIRSTIHIWVVSSEQYEIFALVPQTLFRGETVGAAGKCRLFSQALPQADGPSSNPSKQKNITGRTVYFPKMKTVQFSRTDCSSATNCSIENPSTPIWFHPPIFETQGCALTNWDMGKLVDVKGDIPGLNVTTRHGFALKLCANVIRDHCDVDFHTIYCVRGFFTFTILFTFRTRGCSVVETLLDNCSNKYSS